MFFPLSNNTRDFLKFLEQERREEETRSEFFQIQVLSIYVSVTIPSDILYWSFRKLIGVSCEIDLLVGL